MTVRQTSLIWEAEIDLDGVTHGAYGLNCVFESEPPIHDPLYVTSDNLVMVDDEGIDFEQVERFTMMLMRSIPVHEATVVGTAFIEGALQLILVIDHSKRPSSSQTLN